jgi:nucleoside-diphosphate-sugar epimerase
VKQVGSLRIALTGATGFLGRYLIDALAQNNYRLRALVRTLPDHPQLAPHRLELVSGNVGNSGALKCLVQDADVIVHIAGAIKGTDQHLQKINAEGTAQLVASWQKYAPSARFVFVSSMTAREPQLSAYGASKAMAETTVRACPGNWLIVRPPAIYGPWDTETLSIFKAARLPLHPMLGDRQARLGLIHVRDAADALRALCAGGPQQHLLELSDVRLDGYTWREIVLAACASVSTHPRPFHLPPALVVLAARLNGALARMRGQVSIFDEGKAREILHPDWSARASHQVPDALWKPQISMETGFAETAKWYSEAGWL